MIIFNPIIWEEQDPRDILTTAVLPRNISAFVRFSFFFLQRIITDCFQCFIVDMKSCTPSTARKEIWTQINNEANVSRVQ